MTKDRTGGTATVDVTTTPGCVWTATSAADWIGVTAGADGTGTGNVSLTVAANTTTSSMTPVPAA